MPMQSPDFDTDSTGYVEALPNKSSISQYLPLISADEDPQGHTKAKAPSSRDLNIRIDSLIVQSVRLHVNPLKKI